MITINTSFKAVVECCSEMRIIKKKIIGQVVECDIFKSNYLTTCANIIDMD